MSKPGPVNSRSSHASMGSAEESTAPRCCARCRRGTPATGRGECGSVGSCRCHDVQEKRPIFDTSSGYVKELETRRANEQ